jgi:1-deoxy-D-xylulose-5-phosphate reductoisomerase
VSQSGEGPDAPKARPEKEGRPARVALMGSTGSIGTQTLDVIRAEPDHYQVVALAAHRSIDLLAEQAAEFHPQVVAVGDPSLAGELRSRVPRGTEVLAGPEAFADLASEAEVVLNAVVGFAGLPVTLAALTKGRRLALANKESLIAAGPVVREARLAGGGEILPVDSEHCAIHQCLRSGDAGAGEVARILLTASGGPFRGKAAAELAGVSIEDALAHPTWQMGPKITIDSSTLMNKGLEVIEAHELFGVDYDRIDVVVHPQSIIHSMVEFTDGATVAQLSLPDMRLPIAYALGHPRRSPVARGRIDWTQMSQLDFEVPDRSAFRCLSLAYEAGRRGGCAPAWLNAANEVAVQSFLDGALAWTQIADVIEEVLQSYDGAPASGLEAVLAADRVARQGASRAIERRARAA